MNSQPQSKLPQWVQDHMTAYLLTDGAAGHWYDASAKGGPRIVASLLLTTTGRKSGNELQLPLFYGECPEGLVVVASKGGAPEHPAWFFGWGRAGAGACEARLNSTRSARVRPFGSFPSSYISRSPT